MDKVRIVVFRMIFLIHWFISGYTIKVEYFVLLTSDASARHQNGETSQGARDAVEAVELLHTQWLLYRMEGLHEEDLLYFYCIVLL